jgi:hypothetical protein
MVDTFKTENVRFFKTREELVLKYMNNFKNQVKFMLLRSYLGSTHGILSFSDKLHAVSIKSRFANNLSM